MRFFTSLILAFYLGLTTTFLFAEDKTPSLGLILPLSGNAAQIGIAVKNGAELAYSELTENEKKNFKLSFEDDSLLPKNAISAFHKLSNSEKLLAVVVVSSAIGNAIAPLAETLKVPLIVIGVSDPKVSSGRNFSFLHWITPETQAISLAEEMSKRSIKKLGIIIAAQDGFYAISNSIKDQIKKNNIELILEEEITQSEQDFSSLVLKINRNKNLEALFIGMMPGQNASFAKKLRQSGSKIQIIGSELFDDNDEQKAAAGALNGSFYASVNNPSTDFSKKFSEKFPSSATFGAANGYDTVLMIAQYFSERQNNKELVDYLSEIRDFNGACGKYSCDLAKRFALPVQIKNIN